MLLSRKVTNFNPIQSFENRLYQGDGKRTLIIIKGLMKRILIIVWRRSVDKFSGCYCKR